MNSAKKTQIKVVIFQTQYATHNHFSQLFIDMLEEATP